MICDNCLNTQICTIFKFVKTNHVAVINVNKCKLFQLDTASDLDVNSEMFYSETESKKPVTKEYKDLKEMRSKVVDMPIYTVEEDTKKEEARKEADAKAKAEKKAKTKEEPKESTEAKTEKDKKQTKVKKDKIPSVDEVFVCELCGKVYTKDEKNTCAVCGKYVCNECCQTDVDTNETICDECF